MTQTWLWPSWPSPDLHPTWNLTWVGQFYCSGWGQLKVRWGSRRSEIGLSQANLKTQTWKKTILIFYMLLNGHFKILTHCVLWILELLTSQLKRWSWSLRKANIPDGLVITHDISRCSLKGSGLSSFNTKKRSTVCSFHWSSETGLLWACFRTSGLLKGF